MSAEIRTATEVAEWLKVPRSWVERAARDGRLPSMRVGRYRRFSRTDLEQWRHDQTTGDPLFTDRRRRGRRSA